MEKVFSIYRFRPAPPSSACLPAGTPGPKSPLRPSCGTVHCTGCFSTPHWWCRPRLGYSSGTWTHHGFNDMHFSMWVSQRWEETAQRITIPQWMTPRDWGLRRPPTAALLEHQALSSKQQGQINHGTCAAGCSPWHVNQIQWVLIWGWQNKHPKWLLDHCFWPLSICNMFGMQNQSQLLPSHTNPKSSKILSAVPAGAPGPRSRRKPLPPGSTTTAALSAQRCPLMMAASARAARSSSSATKTEWRPLQRENDSHNEGYRNQQGLWAKLFWHHDASKLLLLLNGLVERLLWLSTWAGSFYHPTFTHNAFTSIQKCSLAFGNKFKDLAAALQESPPWRKMMGYK